MPRVGQPLGATHWPFGAFAPSDHLGPLLGKALVTREGPGDRQVAHQHEAGAIGQAQGPAVGSLQAAERGFLLLRTHPREAKRLDRFGLEAPKMHNTAPPLEQCAGLQKDVLGGDPLLPCRPPATCAPLSHACQPRNHDGHQCRSSHEDLHVFWPSAESSSCRLDMPTRPSLIMPTIDAAPQRNSSSLGQWTSPKCAAMHRPIASAMEAPRSAASRLIASACSCINRFWVLTTAPRGMITDIAV